jgi:hypothetical protein
MVKTIEAVAEHVLDDLEWIKPELRTEVLRHAMAILENRQSARPLPPTGEGAGPGDRPGRQPLSEALEPPG